MDYKLELAPIPVTDVDRARDFYVEKFGFALDFDGVVSPELRFVQLTPPGSGCSIYLGIGLSDMAPCSQHDLQLVVPSIEAAYDELTGRGLELENPVDLSWGRFLYFADPDGNQWAIQELPQR